MKVGDRIRYRREELEMSQDELARRLGYKSRSSINKIEKEASGLPQTKIVAIANALHTTPAYIMGWTEKEEKPTVDDRLSKDMQELIGRIKNLPEEKIQLLLQIAKQIE